MVIGRLFGGRKLGGLVALGLVACGAVAEVETPSPAGPAGQVPAPAGPREPAMPGASPSTPAAVLASVGAGKTALASDATDIYFVTSTSAADVDRVGRVSKQGGAVTELTLRSSASSGRRSVARAGNTLIVASGTSLYALPTAGGTPRPQEPAAVASVRAGTDHVLASNGSLAVWMTPAGALFESDGIAPPSPFATPSPIPEHRRPAASIGVGDDAVFVAFTAATPEGAYEGRVLRYTMAGVLDGERVLPGRQSPPLVSVAGRRVLVAFHDGIDELDAATLAVLPRASGATSTRDVASLAAFGTAGVLLVVSTIPDTFGGKLDGLGLSAYPTPTASVHPLGDAGASRLGASLVVDGSEAFWVRREAGASGSPGVIERVALPRD